MPLGKEVDGDPVGTQPPQQPLSFRPMSIVAKLSPISATAELLYRTMLEYIGGEFLARSLYAVARPSVVCLSVTLVHRTQAVVIFHNISTAFGTLAIR